MPERHRIVIKTRDREDNPKYLAACVCGWRGDVFWSRPSSAALQYEDHVGMPVRTHETETRIEQDEYVRVLQRSGGVARLEDIATLFDVHNSTARQALDGMVTVGKVQRVSSRPPIYALPDAEISSVDY